ncbi:hypothetical protein O181_054776 [Austropuccinia psidii MF-1]|uniref:Uncharacterized protein n=1 Tax=Austropuccinia psidii MF-1 TaxID=1389203 RepID=A0A9Q3EA25_9BASI|nr:hypothetical protein [Austropuccinia psidii MF-1]
MVFNSSSFNFLACPGLTNEAISYPTAQEITDSPSHQLQPVASTSQRREAWLTLTFPSAQVFLNWEFWPIRVTREDPTVVNEGQDGVSRLFRRVDRNIREVIVYSNNRMVCGTASEEMASKFSWYEGKLMNKFQRTFDDLGKDN